ncbi:MAG: hypothetical protein RL173_1683 [Fibrobacterota bacterium]
MSEETTSEILESEIPEDVAPSVTDAAEHAPAGPEEAPKQEQPKRELPSAIPYSRFSAVVSEKNQAKARAAELERQLAELTRPQQGAQRESEISVPDPRKYDSIEAYSQAVQEHIHATAQTLASRHSQQTIQAAQQQAEIQTLVGGFNAQAQALAATNPQIGDAIDIFRNLEQDIHPDVFRDIVAEGPGLVWDIVTNQEVMDRLIGATPLQAGRILASIGATSSTQSKPQAIRPNQPPARQPVPVTRTVSGPARVAETDPSKMTQAEYFAWREKQEH